MKDKDTSSSLIYYSDSAYVDGNEYGLTIAFKQSHAIIDKWPLGGSIISQVGMSYEKAKQLVDQLQEQLKGKI